MSIRRFRMLGLFAVLLALAVQLGAGASMPRIDPVAGANVLCHADDDPAGAPSQAPSHPDSCPVCPLCVALHVQPAAVLVDALSLTLPADNVVLKTELPPPSTAPPVPYRPASQPRAPPAFS